MKKFFWADQIADRIIKEKDLQKGQPKPSKKMSKAERKKRIKGLENKISELESKILDLEAKRRSWRK